MNFETLKKEKIEKVNQHKTEWIPYILYQSEIILSIQINNLFLFLIQAIIMVERFVTIDDTNKYTIWMNVHWPYTVESRYLEVDGTIFLQVQITRSAN